MRQGPHIALQHFSIGPAGVAGAHGGRYRGRPQGARVIVIRKYGNRRLYDTTRSRYVNLDEIAAMIRGGDEVRIEDVETGADLTREILLQIVLDVLKGGTLFPLGMLRRIIRASGDEPGHALLRSQLATGLEMLSAQMDRMEALFEPMLRREPARTPPVPNDPPEAAPVRPTGAPDAAPPAAGDDEIDALRARLASLEARLRNP